MPTNTRQLFHNYKDFSNFISHGKIECSGSLINNNKKDTIMKNIAKTGRLTGLGLSYYLRDSKIFLVPIKIRFL